MDRRRGGRRDHRRARREDHRHEELYVVLSGRATFTLDGETAEAPAGAIVFVSDPAVRRGARGEEPGTTILTAGAKPGEAFTPSPWEENADVLPLFEAEEYERARELLLEALERHPDAAGLIYNLACAESRLGEHEAAIGYLARSVELSPSFATYAQTDPDLEALRDLPGFPAEPVEARAGS